MGKLLVVALLAWIVWKYWLQPPRKPAARPLPPVRPLAEEEARAVLGVGADAGPDEIRAAHRRLVSAVHPDRGGSAELTRRINAARDTLLS